LKAIVQTRYGAPKVLELRDIYRPAVGNDQMLVRVRAASVHADVWHATRGAKDAEGDQGPGRTPRIELRAWCRLSRRLGRRSPSALRSWLAVRRKFR
jgi:hypothetical protein